MKEADGSELGARGCCRARAPERSSNRAQEDLEHGTGDPYIVVQVGTQALWRKAAAKQVNEETRKQPEPEEPIDPSLGIPISCDVGGLIVFSAAQLHGTVVNTSGYTRFSIDFRTVNLDDLEAGLGAPNLDSECTGTTLGDFLRVSDLAPIPQETQARYAA